MNGGLPADRRNWVSDPEIVLVGRLMDGRANLGDRRILYLGDDFTTLLGLRERFGARVLEVGDRLAAVLADLAPLLGQLDDLAPSGDACLAWYVSDLAERSPYATPLVRQAGRLALLAEEMAAGGHLLVAVDDAAAAHMAWHEACRLGARPRVAASLRARWALAGPARLARAVRERIAGGRRALARLRLLARLRRQRPVPLDGLRAADVLVVIWGQADTFPAGAPLADAPWLGPVPTILRGAGLKLAYLVNSVHWVDGFAAIAANATAASEPVLMMEDCLDAAALARVCLHGGCPVGPAVPDELTTVVGGLRAEQWTRWRPLEARLAAAVGPWLAAHGVRPRALVMLYENHGWEKALRHGLRRALPQTRVVGVQQSPFAPLYLNFLPSRRELADGMAPDRLVAMGARFRDLFVAAGMAPQRVALGGAPRYAGFLANLPPRGGDGGNLVLACCGPDLDESRELVLKAALAAARHDGLRLVVNFHPLTTPDERASVRDFVARHGAGTAPEWSDLPVRALLSQGPAAVLYCDTNAAFEALAVGATPIHVGRDCGIDLDKLPDGASIHARNVDDIAAAIGCSRLNRPPPDQARAHIDRSMGAVDEGAIIAAVVSDSPL